MPPKLTTLDIECAVTDHFGVRVNTFVPNVSWGLFSDGHEADLVMLRASGWAEEIEIKTNAADIKRDLGKHGGAGHRRNRLMRRLWFAVPMALAGDPSIPAFAGVLGVDVTEPDYNRSRGRGQRVAVVRPAPLNKDSRKLTDAEKLTLLRLGVMRLWSQKRGRQQALSDRRCETGCVDELVARRMRWDRGVELRASWCPEWQNPNPS